MVEVSYLDEKEVLRSLPPGAAAFAYIASMAVDAAWQRQGAASALLTAAERVAGRPVGVGGEHASGWQARCTQVLPAWAWFKGEAVGLR